MRSESRQGLFAIATAVFLVLAGPAIAANFAAEANLNTDTMTWEVSGDLDGALLRVSGQGILVENEFARGALISQGVFANDGSLLPDGNYTWEISKIAPRMSASDQKAIRQSQEGLPVDRDAVSRSESLSGSFTIVNGAIVDPNLAEVGQVSAGSGMQSASEPGMTNAVAEDQQILDDLIVDGSLCVGQDCNNGESFGFDTIRLKENNLRIRAFDTSNSASFPSRDWQITFNETENGGANKFSIDDIDGGRTPFTIEAGAPSDSLYVDDGGRLGFGTSTPVVDLHVKSGNTPTLRLEQDGSSGFTALTWDLAGNETNFFVRDATNGSTLPFRIFPSAPNDALTIEGTTGDIGVGTMTPSEEIHVRNTSGNAALRLETTDGTGGDWIYRVQNNGQFQIRDNAAATIPMRLHAGANADLLNIGGENDGLTAAAGEVNIKGVLAVEGSIEVDGSTVHPDFVFDPDYELPTIDENVAFMMDQRHLPSLPKAPEGLTGPVDLVSHQMGILEELEKAHLYIGELNGQVQALQGLLLETQRRLDELESGASAQ